MGMNLAGFDASKIEVPENDFTPLPAGEYQAVIIDSEDKPNSKGTGRNLNLTLKIEGPTHQGRLVWHTLCMVHPNPQTQQIAAATLSSICRAVNVLTPQDSSELHGKQLTVVLAVRTDQNTGKVFQDVKRYKPRQLAGGGGHMIAEAFGGSQAAPAASGRPW